MASRSSRGRARLAAISTRTTTGHSRSATLAFAAALLGAGALRAETVGGALVKAYFNNPDINQQRAAVRASDENIPKATAGYRPTVTAEADAAISQTYAGLPAAAGGNQSIYSRPRGYGLTINQTLWNGERTFNFRASSTRTKRQRYSLINLS